MYVNNNKTAFISTYTTQSSNAQIENDPHAVIRLLGFQKCWHEAIKFTLGSVFPLCRLMYIKTDETETKRKLLNISNKQTYLVASFDGVPHHSFASKPGNL